VHVAAETEADVRKSPVYRVVTPEDCVRIAEEHGRVLLHPLMGGIDPELPGTAYFDLAAAVKARVPGMHVHAFSPMEVVNGASRTGLSIHDWLARAQDAGLDTIPGIGAVSAAVLTAFILDIDRFDTPGKLVAYFGTLPIEVRSGVDRDGQARGPKRYVMSRRGNDLVRRYLWMAALSALRFNPAVRALYARVVAKHPGHKAVAVGHAMRKLLHLVFAVWKTSKPFDPEHYPWPTPAPA